VNFDNFMGDEIDLLLRKTKYRRFEGLIENLKAVTNNG